MTDIYEPWEPAVGMRVRTYVSPECPVEHTDLDDVVGTVMDEHDREVLEEARRIYGLPPTADDPDWLAKARENLERAARFAQYSDPDGVRKEIQERRFIEEAKKVLLDDAGRDSC